MSLTKGEFDILSKGPIAMRSLLDMISLEEKGYLDGYNITPKGKAALEPYTVNRAIFFAAGLGSRLSPITINTPKPLIRVNGLPMIKTLLDAVISVGITDIVIVRGHLKEQFDQLLYEYPMIKFIDNPFYDKYNNISSAYLVRDLLSNSYVFESDFVLTNPSLISRYQYSSNYLGVPVEETHDWCLLTDDRGIVTNMCLGGRNCHHLFGISYWNHEDGKRLGKHIEEVFDVHNKKDDYWDFVALRDFRSHYEVSVRDCSFEDIVEIDTFQELCSIDNSYQI